MFKKEGEEWKYKKDKRILQMKTAMSEIKKKILERIDCKLDMAQEKIREIEIMAIELCKLNRKRKK